MYTVYIGGNIGECMNSLLKVNFINLAVVRDVITLDQCG